MHTASKGFWPSRLSGTCWDLGGRHHVRAQCARSHRDCLAGAGAYRQRCCVEDIVVCVCIRINGSAVAAASVHRLCSGKPRYVLLRLSTTSPPLIFFSPCYTSSSPPLPLLLLFLLLLVPLLLASQTILFGFTFVLMTKLGCTILCTNFDTRYTHTHCVAK